MSWEQRNEYFCKAQTDMQMIYIEAEREVRQLKAENAKLRKYAKLMHDHINECCNACGERCICDIDALTRELGSEVD